MQEEGTAADECWLGGDAAQTPPAVGHCCGVDETAAAGPLPCSLCLIASCGIEEFEEDAAAEKVEGDDEVLADVPAGAVEAAAEAAATSFSLALSLALERRAR